MLRERYVKSGTRLTLIDLEMGKKKKKSRADEATKSQ